MVGECALKTTNASRSSQRWVGKYFLEKLYRHEQQTLWATLKENCAVLACSFCGTQQCQVHGSVCSDTEVVVPWSNCNFKTSSDLQCQSVKGGESAASSCAEEEGACKLQASAGGSSAQTLFLMEATTKV